MAVAAYDADERIHPPAPSFLSRPPTTAERRRLRREVATMPPPPELVFWPESAAIDGPWGAMAPEDRRHHPQEEPARHRRRTPEAPAGISTGRLVAPDRCRHRAREAPARIGTQRQVARV